MLFRSASERQVVIEERRLRVDNEIAGMMDEELGALVYKAHPYRWPVIGWMKDIENIRREDCLEYALQVREKAGVWGGATERERRRMIRQRRRSA